MGMDVSGKAPTSKKGEYFRNNCWHWRPLWMYCEHVAPKLCAKVKYAQSNDGDGLDKNDSIMLAQALKGELSSGRTAQYEDAYKMRIANIPEEECDICNGTGKRAMEPNKGAECNGCEGKGKRKSMASWYPFSVENVAEFAGFLEDCGGFEIF